MPGAWFASIDWGSSSDGSMPVFDPGSRRHVSLKALADSLAVTPDDASIAVVICAVGLSRALALAA